MGSTKLPWPAIDVALAAKFAHQVAVDLGYRRVDAENPDAQIIHGGKFKSLTVQ